MIKVGIGQDSHCFLTNKTDKKCIIGGIIFDDVPGLEADSDGDVVLHSLCNAISSVTGVPILGGIAIKMCCEKGITDSALFVEEAKKTLHSQKINHVAFTIEAARPRLEKKLPDIRHFVANLLNIEISQVGITCTSGDGLTSFGRGEGLQCFCILTTVSI
jgi:2-C-methyl-D-erythritol 2,4-cyclodiphosphate synthase